MTIIITVLQGAQEMLDELINSQRDIFLVLPKKLSEFCEWGVESRDGHIGRVSPDCCVELSRGLLTERVSDITTGVPPIACKLAPWGITSLAKASPAEGISVAVLMLT